SELQRSAISARFPYTTLFRSFTLDDVAFLRSADGVAALRACAGLELSERSRLGDVATAREIVGVRAPAVLETLLLRRRARDKLRSEEHTSELQSRENLVCRLL